MHEFRLDNILWKVTYNSVQLTKHEAMKIVNIFYSCYICSADSAVTIAAASSFLLLFLCCEETQKVYESIVLPCFFLFVGLH